MKDPAVKMLLFVLALILTAAFGFVGFAALSDELTVGGSVEVAELNCVYIYSTEHIAGDNIKVNAHSVTVLNSTVSLGESSSSYSILKITVKNNTSKEYGYSATTRQSGINDSTYSNEDIVFAVCRDEACTLPLRKRTAIAPGETLDFYVKFTYSDSASIASGGEKLNSVLKFNFITPISDIQDTESDQIISDALNQFTKILNTESTYTELYDAMQAKYNGKDWHVSYIGNVAGSAHTDTAALDKIFNNILMINIDGVDVNTTLIVKMENIDNNVNTGGSYTIPTQGGATYSGCEMTLYLTTVTINDETFDTYQYVDPIYAVVFTKDSADSEWYQLGEMYKGKAQCVGYVGGNDNDSFDTGTWISTERYYNVAANSGIQNIIQKRAVDKSALQAKINEAAALKQSNYTSESWAEFKEKLDLARSANNSYATTQALVQTRLRELTVAMDALVSQIQ
ncbi:MAG: hypothetical protein E7679_00920 [Ruminococcaceae bacterium]|nr:hypothetical protein [Oscillospiraceae bacterium]